ncbi:tetratricopeptide repeat protein [Paenibacillus sp. NPDC058177]|uniref:tetratricopeptide repeat protein n=1 Tax=Paenibacillus sp. NPDC058177 TaxID=3346369 RepID=UPI0036DF3988
MTTNGQQFYRFSEAPIWELQRAYFEEKGMKAWEDDEVPQYITSNPMIAEAYAEMIFGFLQDRAAQGHVSEPVTILELGAGAGRLAFHIVRQLREIRNYAGLTLPPVRYVMSDLAAKNVASWQRHPGLLSLVDEGLLDFARFDAVNDTELHLTQSKVVIRPGDLEQPLLVIANYFFCSIPQELLYVDEGKIFECEVALKFPEQVEGLSQSELLKKVVPEFQYRRAASYEEDTHPYQGVIQIYQDKLEDSHILFPAAGLMCMERLNALSQAGFLLITADKGDHRLENWEFAPPPELIHHGCFSLTANYHAIQHAFEQKGAVSLFTQHHYKDINAGCILMLQDPASYVQTRLAYRRFIDRFGPDDFYCLKGSVDQHLGEMELRQLLAFWRLGGYDAELFIHSAEHISTLLQDCGDEELLDLQRGIQIMWANHYAMEASYDLALDCGLLLFEMDQFAQAREFLERSVLANPDEPVVPVLYSLAICNYELGDEAATLDYTTRALELEPEYEEALELLNALKQGVE